MTVEFNYQEIAAMIDHALLHPTVLCSTPTHTITHTLLYSTLVYCSLIYSTPLYSTLLYPTLPYATPTLPCSTLPYASLPGPTRFYYNICFTCF